MEEEIRVLESCWVMTTDHVLDEGNIALKLAIKNFIKGYKQLEKENAELRKNQCTHNIDNECLRKSVIREKIEEIQKLYEEALKKSDLKEIETMNHNNFKGIQLEGQRRILKELLGGK